MVLSYFSSFNVNLPLQYIHDLDVFVGQKNKKRLSQAVPRQEYQHQKIGSNPIMVLLSWNNNFGEV